MNSKLTLIASLCAVSIAGCGDDDTFAADDGGDSADVDDGGSTGAGTTAAPTTTAGPGGTTGSDTDGSDDGATTGPSGTDDGGCQPITCADQGFDCGTIFDGCGGTEDCGTCGYPAQCGFATPNVCGCDPAVWIVEQVDFMGNVGQFSSMVVDGNDDVHVVYYDTTNLSLKYARRDAATTTWTDETVDNSGQVGRYTSMVIDTAGTLHASYRHDSNGALNYARRPAGGNWTTEEVDGFGGVGSSIAVDASGVVHISHLTPTQIPRYASGTPGAWTLETTGSIVGAHATAQESSIAVAPNGVVHIAYGGESRNGTSGQLSARQLFYANRATIGSWTMEAVEGFAEGIFVGYYADLELDPTGAVHIVHYDTMSGDLRYATNPSPPTGTWTTEVIDSTDDVGAWPSLEVDEFGTLHVSYYDATNEVAKYATRPLAGSWTAGVLTAGSGLPTESQVGQHSWLTAQSSTELHVTYYEGGSDDLYYAFLPACP